MNEILTTLLPWIFGAIVLFLGYVSLFTEGGKNFWRKITGGASAKADQLAEDAVSAQLLARQNELEQTAKVREQLSSMESARSLASQQLALRDENLAKIKEYEANADLADEKIAELKGDNIPDSQQKEIGILEGAAENALAEADRIRVELESNTKLFADAEEAIRKADNMSAMLPAHARKLISEGNLNAAAIAISAANITIAHGMSAFSEENQTADDLRARRKKAEADAEAANARMMSAPASPDVTRMIIESAGGSRTSRLDARRAAKATPAKSEEAAS